MPERMQNAKSGTGSGPNTVLYHESRASVKIFCPTGMMGTKKQPSAKWGLWIFWVAIRRLIKFGLIGESAWLPRSCIHIWGRGPKNPFLYAPHYQISWSINAFLKVFGVKPLFQKGLAGVRGRAPRSPVPDKLQATSKNLTKISGR